jgi:hypothetical protein
MKSTILYFTLFFIFYQAQAQIRELAADQEAGKGNLSQMEWLTGYWTGEGFGGECEEVWMPLVDIHIIGTFRFWSEGKLIFSEFMNLVQEGDTFLLASDKISASEIKRLRNEYLEISPYLPT